MVTMQKAVAIWSGFTGAPGYSTLWFQGSSIIDPSVIFGLFNAYAPYIPTTVSIAVQNTGELVEPTDGKVMGTWASGTIQTVTGTGTSALSPTAGLQVRIETGAFRRGKHIRGRVFFIPMGSANFATGGVLNAAMVSAMQTAANNLRSASGAQWGVFHRPVYDRTVKPPVLKTPGEFIASQSVFVPSKVCSLTSRRD